jgi:hypothetical protein
MVSNDGSYPQAAKKPHDFCDRNRSGFEMFDKIHFFSDGTLRIILAQGLFSRRGQDGQYARDTLRESETLAGGRRLEVRNQT